MPQELAQLASVWRVFRPASGYRCPSSAIMATKRLTRDFERTLARIETEGAIFAERLQTDEAREVFRPLPNDASRAS